ncbi:MAG: type II secretion system GspH family protein [Gemmatimonadota bacterium]|nr:type II secretion system GspH family protein [Gemmatimonadota bacterium]
MKKVLRAFTLLEVVATLAVLSILAAATVPSVVAYLTRQNIEKTAAILTDLSTSIAAFRVKIARYPFRISHLGSNILGTDTTSCSGIGPATPTTTYTNLTANKWGQTNGGPFNKRVIPTTGFPTPIGTIIDTIYRTGNSNNAASSLPLIIRNVRFEDAEELNAFIDGDADNGDRSNSAGLVQWSAPVNELVDVVYTAVATTTKVC